jgi:hypothetical protein
MDKDGFREFLKKQKFPDELMDGAIGLVEQFETFLTGQGSALESATSEEAREFIDLMMEKNLNNYDNFVILLRYGYFIGNNTLYIAFLEPIDGAEVMDVLQKKLGDAAGEKLRNKVFDGIDLPPLGTSQADKPKITQAVMERMETLVDPVTCEKALIEVAHGLPKEFYDSGQREKFLAAKNIDVYLEDKRNSFIAQMEKHRDEKTAFFNQEIDDEVVQWLKDNPGVGSAKREGDYLIHTKIPYLTKEYLNEKDEKMKRYYACHCAWAREAIKTGENEVSPTFCYCSGGFTVKPWEIAFDQPLEVEMLESALNGDMKCTFKIPLPKEVLEKVVE